MVVMKSYDGGTLVGGNSVCVSTARVGGNYGPPLHKSMFQFIYTDVRHEIYLFFYGAFYENVLNPIRAHLDDN